MSSRSWMRREDCSLKSKFRQFQVNTAWYLHICSEKEDLELQLRAVPDIEKRIAELTA